jgi:hypothetical protein
VPPTNPYTNHFAAPSNGPNTVLVQCPYCGGEHRHGNVGAEPTHRVADCGKGGYMVGLAQLP